MLRRSRRLLAMAKKENSSASASASASASDLTERNTFQFDFPARLEDDEEEELFLPSSSSGSSNGSGGEEAEPELEMKKTHRTNHHEDGEMECESRPKAKRMKREERKLLVDLGNLLTGKVLARPSKLVRTPYVADVEVKASNGETMVVQAHTPALGCAGMISPGKLVEMEKMHDTGNSSRKTTHTIHLCHDVPRSNGSVPVVGAHPTLAERFTRACLENFWIPELGRNYKFASQKTYKKSRVDFVLEHDDSTITLLEVKNVVCADYLESERKHDETRLLSCLCDEKDEKLRSALFPHGKRKPKSKVVSERAIKHVQELTQIHKSMSKDERKLRSAILFLVNRSDCERFRPCHESDPLFSKVLQEAHEAGVLLLAHDVQWQAGKAFLGKSLPIEFHESVSLSSLDENWLQQVLECNQKK